MLVVGERATENLELEAPPQIDHDRALEATLQQDTAGCDIRCRIGKIDTAGDGDGASGTEIPATGRGTGCN